MFFQDPTLKITVGNSQSGKNEAANIKEFDATFKLSTSFVSNTVSINLEIDRQVSFKVLLEKLFYFSQMLDLK